MTSTSTTAPTGHVPVPGGGHGVEREFTVRARTQGQLIRRRFFHHRLAVMSLVILIVVVVLAYTYSLWWHFDYKTEDFEALSKGPTIAHPLGTDDIGRDEFARIAQGIQTSVEVGLLGTLVADGVGVLLGLIAGFYRGKIDALIMRFADVVLTFPSIALAAVLSRVVSPSWWTIALILGGLGIPITARLVRSVVLSLREREFVEAARALGSSDTRILVRHILPNALGPIIVDITLNIAVLMLAEAGLAFIGFGIQPPNVSLGGLISDGVSGSSQRPWVFYFPGIAIIILVLTINFVGDGLRDAFDPTQQRVRA